VIYLLAFILLHPALLLIFVAWAKTDLRLIAAVGVVLSVALNYTTASAIWGWPRKGEWTISKRLKRQQLDAGWRGRWAWQLAHFLNSIKPDHI